MMKKRLKLNQRNSTLALTVFGLETFLHLCYIILFGPPSFYRATPLSDLCIVLHWWTFFFVVGSGKAYGDAFIMLR